MKTNYEIRYAAHPEDAKSYDTARLRRDFLIEKVFTADEVNMVYSMYDRMVVGGAMPVAETLRLEAIDPLKAPFFLTRREMGIYNVGGPGVVKAGDAVFELGYKEALYLGSGDREVTFASEDAGNPAKFYFNSLTAHRNYPDKKVTKADAVVAHMGSLEGSNDRNINKMLVNQVLPTCQLQMGMTELLPGSVLNRIVVPKKITVHLGKPSANVRNVTVSFQSYIANVASSEVYPTWDSAPGTRRTSI